MVTAASGSSTAAVNSSTSVTGRYDGVLLSTGELEAAFSTLRHHCLFSVSTWFSMMEEVCGHAWQVDAVHIAPILLQALCLGKR
jgi:hypothetical protein